MICYLDRKTTKFRQNCDGGNKTGLSITMCTDIQNKAQFHKQKYFVERDNPHSANYLDEELFVK